MIRIKDIADRAGVSPTTVSNVIHGKTGRVSKATVEKINRILKEMEYVPSISARMLANNSSGLIGVALGFMKKGNASSFEDPFVSAMLGNLEYQIREHGYYMMLVARHEQDDIMQQALGWNFDGMIAMALKEKEIAELSERLGKPLVTIDQYLPPELGVRSITMDDRGGAYQMSQYLIGKGHKKFLFLSDCDLGVDHYRWLGVSVEFQTCGFQICQTARKLKNFIVDLNRIAVPFRAKFFTLLCRFIRFFIVVFIFFVLFIVISGPADTLSVFILGGILRLETERIMPVHVNDKHIERGKP